MKDEEKGRYSQSGKFGNSAPSPQEENRALFKS